MNVISKNLKEYGNLIFFCFIFNHVLYACFRLKKKGEKKKEIEELESNILKRKAQLAEIEQTLPKPNGVYLKIILGNVNVSILNREEK